MAIRNFSIIAHIDHGKSTLADRMIERTGVLEERQMRDQFLDTMELEQERGITIKLQPIRMQYQTGGEMVQLNLIDTPGHTDFRYEVSRSLAACEGALLLVDASQGIQAQTLAVLYAAMEHDLTIIPVLNKIDLPAAEPERVGEEVRALLGCSAEDVLHISAKEGRGVDEVLQAIVERIPPPSEGHWLGYSGDGRHARGLIFDAVMDPYRGAVAYVRMVNGNFAKGEPVYLPGTGAQYDILDVGHFTPLHVSDEQLREGEIGYIVTGAKDVSHVRTGDTIASGSDVQPLPGYREIQPMVYAGVYPSEASAYPALRDALERLAVNDAALVVEPERNVALGNGFRCGFLGLLHMDIVQERLEREHDCDLIITAPGVRYEVVLQAKRPAEVVRSSMLKEDEPDTAVISNPADMPDPTYIQEIREPWVRLEVLCRNEDVGTVIQLAQERRGQQQSMDYLEADRVHMHFDIPLQSVISDFFDSLKSATSGFGSLSYEPIGYRAGDLVKLQILLHGEPAEALSTIVHRNEAYQVGSAICAKLKDVLPRAQFAVPIQAAIGSKVVARETLPALRKDVTGHLYGGDVSRKKKLLAKQKKGKDRLKKMGKVTLTQEAFLSVLAR